MSRARPPGESASRAIDQNALRRASPARKSTLLRQCRNNRSLLPAVQWLSEMELERRLITHLQAFLEDSKSRPITRND